MLFKTMGLGVWDSAWLPGFRTGRCFKFRGKKKHQLPNVVPRAVVRKLLAPASMMAEL